MKKIKIILSSIILVILVPILFLCSVILIDSFMKPDEVPSFFGWKPFIVLSGSMETEIYPGDVVVVKEVDTNEIKENEIIAFKKNDVVITHRVVDIIKENGTTKFKTKGDNNNTEDSGYVLAEQVEGVYQFKIKSLGNFAMFTQTPVGMLICLSIPSGMLLLIQMLDSHGHKKNSEKGEKHERENEVVKDH